MNWQIYTLSDNPASKGIPYLPTILSFTDRILCKIYDKFSILDNLYYSSCT